MPNNLLNFTIVGRGLFKGLSFLLLPAIIWLFVNATINRHNHYVSEGVIISHAHPCNSNSSDPAPFQSHHHSDKELLLISIISDPLVSFVILLVLVGVLFSLPPLLIRCYPAYPAPVPEYYLVYHYHAPPVI